MKTRHVYDTGLQPNNKPPRKQAPLTDPNCRLAVGREHWEPMALRVGMPWLVDPQNLPPQLVQVLDKDERDDEDGRERFLYASPSAGQSLPNVE
eukprot:CAMPEP_0206212412 /NCGR_PEP_ID=MMETSP0047_2-20121206/551_1 /ASSEMBLY_ACC=CAM_ASM_000192 /TAXON_ID=195065 /ORGANISM="Chroomonas mesostigmatica_cf, Strain CCMP1168" /LENGTH=93 /DNA_ID=CAMNT_0053634445 /DNA_START=9 /DNA_END=291 /DNA_ORIENTATION=-